MSSGYDVEEGMQFGRWVAIIFDKKVNSHPFWIFKCLGCDKNYSRATFGIVNGDSLSCRQCYLDERCDISPGDFYGKWEVIKRESGKWLCRCECGIERLIRTVVLKDAIACRSCVGKMSRGSNSSNWNGGRYIGRGGYAWLSNQYDHPNSRPNGKIPEHVFVMSQIIGRPLVSKEEVHHKNGIRDDNTPSNLELWSTSHPAGQRVEDKLRHAFEMIQLYSSLFPEIGKER